MSDLDGLHVERRGSGRALVLTHGFTDSSRAWAPQVEALRDSHTVVTWDLRGHGRSDHPTSTYDREAALADLAAVVDEAGAGPAVLGGHSLGGYFSLAFALRHPDRVAGLALVACGPGFRNPERREAYNRAMLRMAERRGIDPETAAVARQDDSLVIDGLRSIMCPTVVVIGRDDDELYTIGSQVIAERIPGARLIEVEGAGHDVHRDQPDAVAAAFAELLGS